MIALTLLVGLAVLPCSAAGRPCKTQFTLLMGILALVALVPLRVKVMLTQGIVQK